MGKKDQPSRREVRQDTKKWGKEIRDTPSGNLGISSDDAYEAIQRGKREAEKGGAK